jgi:sugar/nucleoside kinase (ribokinase family)
MKTLGYIPVIAVKKGKVGAIARQGSEFKTVPAMRVKVKDTVGAGDSFDSGFLYGYLYGFGVEKSLKLASVCGSLSTTEAGGIAGQCTLSKAMPYLKKLKCLDP